MSHVEHKEAGEDDPEEDETPVVIPSSAVTMHPKGTQAPASSVEAQVLEERVDLSNDMTWRQMIAVGVRRVVLARGELDRLEGPRYAARRVELRRKAKEAARTRDRQAAPEDEAEESDATEEACSMVLRCSSAVLDRLSLCSAVCVRPYVCCIRRPS